MTEAKSEDIKAYIDSLSEDEIKKVLTNCIYELSLNESVGFIGIDEDNPRAHFYWDANGEPIHE